MDSVLKLLDELDDVVAALRHVGARRARCLRRAVRALVRCAAGRSRERSASGHVAVGG